LVVDAELDADESALFSTSCEAELSPASMSPPAMFTGTLALSAFCVAVASESASWSVYAS